MHLLLGGQAELQVMLESLGGLPWLRYDVAFQNILSPHEWIIGKNIGIGGNDDVPRHLASLFC